MSNLRDSISERASEGAGPSASGGSMRLNSTSGEYRFKFSHGNITKSPAGSPTKPKNSSKRRETKQRQNNEVNIPTNSGVENLIAKCDTMNVNSESQSPPVVKMRKNARKKENLKKLVMPHQLQQPLLATQMMPHQLQQPLLATQTMPHQTQQPLLATQMMMPHSAPAAPESSQVHEFFKHQISPLYATQNARYLENLAHHPHFQLMYGIQSREMVPQKQYFVNVPPNTPMSQSDPWSPSYLRNALQHPLLSQSHTIETYEQLQQSAAAQYTDQCQVMQPGQSPVQRTQNNAQTASSPKHKRNKKNGKPQKADGAKFEPFITLVEVENGLKCNKLIEGVLRINPKQFQYCYVSSTDRSEQDVMVDGVKHRNRALEGDIVVVELIVDSETSDEPDSNKQKKGKVVFIKEKVHPRTCIGTLKLMPDKNRLKALFIPRDYRVPRLNIPCLSWPDNFYKDAIHYEKTLFLAKILDWSDTRFAVGIILCLIGQSGDMVTETKAILAQNDLDITPFGPEYRDLFPTLDYVIPEEEISKREDCRKMCIFSIDPFNCRDIDDAVSCRELPNGNYEIGVHISDVAHFLADNTILDDKVAKKATTIYLVEKAYHMLPDELCMLCSLFPGVDKLAFSVFWEITKDAKVLNHRFAKTVIRSCCQLAYDHAQAVLDDKPNAHEGFPEIYNGYKYEDVHKVIKALGSIAATFRKNRFEGGALRIDQPKVSFKLSPSNLLPESFWVYESKESHQLIEEFMLLANMTVAERIMDDHPNLAFLRCHPSPSGFMLKQLEKCLKAIDIDLDCSSAGDLHRSMMQYIGPEDENRGRALVLNMLCTKPMARAKYFCAGGYKEEFSHYALNVPLYTHFTSPIRRYADIMVHRLLAASIKCRDTPKWEVDRVRMTAAQCNKQKYNAKRAGEMSTELYTLKYIELNSPFHTEAVVVEVREKYIDVIVIAMGLNRKIFFNNDFPGTFNCIKNDIGAKLAKMEVTWRAVDNQPQMTQLIQIFSVIPIEMCKGEEPGKIDTRLVRPFTVPDKA